jgi:hypothetical protein
VELDARSIFTLVVVMCGLAATWGMVRAQLAAAQASIAKLMATVHDSELRMDTIESREAVQASQMTTITAILHPDNLRMQAERAGSIAQRLQALEESIKTLQIMHNHRHPPQDSS